MENKNLEETDVNEKQEVGNGKSAMPMNLPGYDSGRGLCGLSGCFSLPECNKWC